MADDYERHVKLIFNPWFWILNFLFGLILFCAFLPVFIYTGNIKPECTLVTFYVPSLNKFNEITPQSSTNTSSNIFFNLSLKNLHDQKGIHYDDVNITFSYDTNPRSVIGSYRLNNFYHGKDKTAKVRGVVVVSRNDTGLRLLSFGASNSTTTTKIRIDLITKVKFKFKLSYSNKNSLMVGHSFEVDDTGKKVGKNPLKLNSGASAGARGVFFQLAVCLFTFTFFVLN